MHSYTVCFEISKLYSVRLVSDCTCILFFFLHLPYLRYKCQVQRDNLACRLFILQEFEQQVGLQAGYFCATVGVACCFFLLTRDQRSRGRSRSVNACFPQNSASKLSVSNYTFMFLYRIVSFFAETSSLYAAAAASLLALSFSCIAARFRLSSSARSFLASSASC